MSKHQFTLAERWAVYTVHGNKCYLCKRPIDLKTMEVDHIIPESLLSDLEKLRSVLQQLNLEPDFEINSFENWMPSCRPCNNLKRDTVFDPAPIITIVLNKAKQKAPIATREAEQTVSNTKLSRALTVVEMALHGEDIEENIDKIRPIIAAYEKAVRNIELQAENTTDNSRIHLDLKTLGPGIAPLSISLNLLLRTILRSLGWYDFVTLFIEFEQKKLMLTPEIEVEYPVILRKWRSPRIMFNRSENE